MYIFPDAFLSATFRNEVVNVHVVFLPHSVYSGDRLFFHPRCTCLRLCAAVHKYDARAKIEAESRARVLHR